MKKQQKSKKKEVPKVDGLSAKDVAKIRSAIRQIWYRSYPRKKCVSRAIGKDGFFYCENCLERTPKITVDHIQKVGKLDGGFFKRMFCSSENLSALCVACHRKKTNEERKQDKAKRD